MSASRKGSSPLALRFAATARRLPAEKRQGSTLPEVQLPQTGVPAVDEVTGDVQDVTNGLTGALP